MKKSFIAKKKNRITHYNGKSLKAALKYNLTELIDIQSKLAHKLH